MYILKNAWTSITRNKGRNILIGIIITVISAACAVTLAIRQSANDIVTAYQTKNPIEATIGMNRNALMNSLREGNKSQEEMINAFNEIESLTEEEIISYGTSDYIKEYYYSYSLGVNAKDLEEATDSLVKETTEVKTETNTSTWGSPKDGGFHGGRPGESGGYGGSTTNKKTTTTRTEKIFNEKAQNGAFTLIGYNSYEDMKDFINGNYTIIEGEVSEDFNSTNCVISEELATLNELSVGDIITIVDVDNEKNTYELTVTGIYKENTESSNNMSSMFSNSANNIITNVSFIKTVLETNENLSATITPTFILNDKEDIEEFTKEVEEKGLSEYYTITDNISEIESATESITNVKTFATTFLIITLIIGGIVLVVINMINIRERKYEIGVLRTIGMKKVSVSIQFMLELLIVCIVSLMLGAVAGSFSSVPVANSLLQNEIENANSQYDDINQNFGIPNGRGEEQENNSQNRPNNNKGNFRYNFGIANINQVDTIEAVVDVEVLVQLLGIGVLLTLVSSLASMIAISRFSPLTILKERS